MEIVPGEPTPSVEHDEAVRLLHEMAAAVRTVFAVARPAETPVEAPVGQAPVVQAPAPVAAPVAIPVPAAIPVPDLQVPPVPDSPDSADRHSLALLQEIAFLDD